MSLSELSRHHCPDVSLSSLSWRACVVHLSSSTCSIGHVPVQLNCSQPWMIAGPSFSLSCCVAVSLVVLACVLQSVRWSLGLVPGRTTDCTWLPVYLASLPRGCLASHTIVLLCCTPNFSSFSPPSLLSFSSPAVLFAALLSCPLRPSPPRLKEHGSLVSCER